MISHSPERLIEDLRRYIRREVPADIATRALRAARATYPEGDDHWVVERAAYLIKRKS